jgi:nitrite reductase/ring-hydroxylating ferredoxin subunit
MSGEWHRICRVEEVEDGQPVARVVDGADSGDHRVCVVKGQGDEFVALLDRCPHRDIPLSGGLVKDGMLTCPGHFWRFDLTTGSRSDLPEVHLTRYATRVRNGWVEASVPPSAPRRSMREWLLAQARGDD